MRTALLALALFASAPSVAAEQAEYYRLTQEMEKLAQRNAWSGVERAYERILETGVTPSFEDHLFGAHAARALGDATNARVRLVAANGLREEREVIDWLYTIDNNYGRVFLAADPGTMELVPEIMPFDPHMAKAIEYAQTQIVETGMFEGLLPKGSYTFGAEKIEVAPRVGTVRIDVRTDEGLEAQRKLEKKKEREEKKDTKHEE
jgi:hypothetical protein